MYESVQRGPQSLWAWTDVQVHGCSRGPSCRTGGVGPAKRDIREAGAIGGVPARGYRGSLLPVGKSASLWRAAFTRISFDWRDSAHQAVTVVVPCFSCGTSVFLCRDCETAIAGVLSDPLRTVSHSARPLRTSHPERRLPYGTAEQVTQNFVPAEVDESAIDQPGAVAIVHDYLTQRGGAERVVLAMHRAFPAAPIYTSLYEPDLTFPEFRKVDVRPSYLNRSNS